MPLGIEQNNIAPSLISSAGDDLVQNIRLIGQQVSGHLTEIQTRRDLGAMAQEMQGLNVRSADFPQQAIQLATRHPMAIRDERGQMALGMLSKAHGQWQAEQNAALVFQRQMQMADFRTKAANERAIAADESRAKRPVSVFGVGLVDPLTGTTIVPEGSRGGATTSPRVLSPGAVLVDPTGKKLAENPKPEPSLTPYQRETLDSRKVAAAAARKKQNKDLLMRQDTAAQAEIRDTVKRLDSIEKEILGVTNPEDRNALFEKKNQIIKEANDLKQRRLNIQKSIEQIESIPAEEIAAKEIADDTGEPTVVTDPQQATAVGVLPEPGALPAPEVSNELVAVINPSGKPVKIRRSQLDAALQNGYKQR